MEINKEGVTNEKQIKISDAQINTCANAKKGFSQLMACELRSKIQQRKLNVK